ncbi:methylenetetrahydrofolate reductase C-terminal domain-containing protein [Candidatus Acetothermia bacterium]|jgi:ferredoxin|nr:methylenetetrahydrofolate reductase C-terminal domain-containing protein [Candidatus Acetothermia bacterium]MCI2427422.1 methylenetetrahydrofolate reductase C-terminal domain-containing protein [Candidatus Acetothermia bacterium]MCI2428727.1 methylenetetrahydrofolate reductase C-terminal domain-containing protein [Candidatus Acetothermia bacterium]
MIITKQRLFSEILDSLVGEKTVFLVGCGECATVCQTGGEDEVKALSERLQQAGKIISGSVVLEPACNLLEAKRQFRKYRDLIEQSDSLLAMSCGGGAQIAQEASGKIVHPANESLFLGTVKRFGQFEEYCSMCGDCVLDTTGGICPITRCSKGLLNGPCGGSQAEKCEVDSEKDCGWVMIYKRLKEIGKLASLISTSERLRDHSRTVKPANRQLTRDKGVKK